MLRIPCIIASLLLVSACGVEELEAILAKYDTFGSTGSTADTSTGTADTGTDTSSGGVAETDGEDAQGTSTSGLEGTGAGSETSTTHAGTGTESTGGVPPPVCGDGIKQGDEECDDANDVEADGCLGDCTKEWFVFITSEPSTSSDFKGLIGADYQCRHRATKMFLPNGERYMAWISTSEVQPVDRLYHARGPYKLVNGLRVAANWDALTSGHLEHPINVTETSETNDTVVFTGTQPDGTRAPNSTFCDNWTDNDGFNFGWIGDSAATNQDWTFGIESPCGGGAAIYCFEQP